ncbi:hypothetical protein Dacsa_2905 [Dactylococcopsis salina PCC 8305]|uniref:Uncharacterized protein n=2 Tax=Dactylococcopsis salina TaxID=292566 RepID=K9YZA5_DACS8|nr:hypothetical protein Dacsa_2905 [Dactylococcopsis salina PCC 8305]
MRARSRYKYAIVDLKASWESMTALAQYILQNFDQLPNKEQQKVALEILKRIVHSDFPPLEDQDLVLSAEEIFLSLDQQESDYE